MTHPTMIGRPLIHVRVTSSTMDVMTALADRGAPAGAVVVADYQTSGQGRAGHSWNAEPRSSVLMSFLHVSRRPQISFGLLSPALGLAVAKAMDAWLADRARLKWPNDVLIDDRKVAGILIRSRPIAGADAIRIIGGIGVNVTESPEAISASAISLSAAAGRAMTVEAVLEGILASVSTVLTRFENGDDVAIATECNGRLAWRGQMVSIVDAQRVHSGIMDGISSDGSLCLIGGDGHRIQFIAGDLTRGPRPE